MPALTPRQAALLHDARRAVLATIRDDGTPRLVPITFAADTSGGSVVLYSPLDEKPKSVAEPRRLARVRDILVRPQAAVLVDRWSEDWSELAWLRLDGTASLLDPAAQASSEHERAVGLLRQRYAQYRAQQLGRLPIIRLDVQRLSGWSST